MKNAKNLYTVKTSDIVGRPWIVRVPSEARNDGFINVASFATKAKAQAFINKKQESIEEVVEEYLPSFNSKPVAKKETTLKAKLTDGNWYDVTCTGHALEIAHSKSLEVLRIE